MLSNSSQEVLNKLNEGYDGYHSQAHLPSCCSRTFRYKEPIKILWFWKLIMDLCPRSVGCSEAGLAGVVLYDGDL